MRHDNLLKPTLTQSFNPLLEKHQTVSRFVVRKRAERERVFEYEMLESLRFSVEIE